MPQDVTDDNLSFLQNMRDYHHHHRVHVLDNILFMYYCNKGNDYPDMDSIYDEYQYHTDREVHYQMEIDFLCE